jgi:hypothetical protein
MDQSGCHCSVTVICAALAVLASCGDATHAQNDEQTVVVTNLEKPGAFEVENRGSSIELSSQVIVQRLEDGKWQDRATDLVLSDRCDSNQASLCRTLPHAAKLRPVPWNGELCSGQCMLGCRANAFLGPGQLRFVVTTCDRKRRFYGPVFTLPDYDHSDLKKSRDSNR